jgi:riboflavin biosynthesis pyrimidine reductase
MFAPDVALVTQAADALGWQGEVIGPVEFGGVRFWAVARCGSQPELGSESLLELVGCLVCGPAEPELQQAVSLLAAYTPRAIVVEGGRDVTHLLVDAALLDQGLVEVNANDVRCLSSAGPRTATGQKSSRERRLLDQVAAVRDQGRISIG